MTVVGFNFTTINVERKSSVKGKININNNIKVTDVESSDLFLGANKQSGMRVLFEFAALYEPAVATISLKGEILYLEDEKKVEDIVKGWKKDKKLPPKLMEVLLNTAFSKCSIEALLLSKEVNLPPPVRLPRVGVKSSK